MRRWRITYLVPFELLLLSYVVLGPAHYFTEISWLHDRKYFLPPSRRRARARRRSRVAAALIDNAIWFGFVMWTAFVACALLAAATTAAQSADARRSSRSAVTVTMVPSNGSSLAVLGILLPTLIHVSLFTLVFMTLGRVPLGQQASQALLVVIYLAAIVLILAAAAVRQRRISRLSPRLAQDYFGNVAPGAGPAARHCAA